MKIAAFLSGSDPDVDELSALHGNMDIFQAMYMKDKIGRASCRERVCLYV